jgi:hypothetical protein
MLCCKDCESKVKRIIRSLEVSGRSKETTLEIMVAALDIDMELAIELYDYYQPTIKKELFN